MTKKPTILLLEDDRAIRSLMVDGLKDEGYDVVELADPNQTRTELQRLDGRAVLVADRDIGDEGVNGFDIAAAAMREFPMLRVVYVSGTHLAIKHRALSPRERSLIKPFAISQLAGLVKQLS